MKYVLGMLLLVLWAIPEAQAQKKLIVKQVEQLTKGDSVHVTEKIWKATEQDRD